MSATKPTPVVVVKEKETPATTDIMGEVVTTFPKALQEKGRQLVSRLKTTQWNDRGELLHEGMVVPGSNVVDLVHDLLRKRKTYDPISWQQFDPKRVGCYGGVAALQRVVSVHDIERWLSEQDTYTLLKPVRCRLKRCCVVVGGPNQQWQADLVDMSRFKKVNDGTTFILIVINVVSKLAWCVPLKNKLAASLVAAFTQLLSNGAPNTLQTDKVTELLNRPLQKLLNNATDVL